MVNKTVSFVKQYWDWILFSFFLFLSTSFLILNRGVWEFADAGFFYLNNDKAFDNLFSKFTAFTTSSSYFGFDNLSNNFPKIGIDFLIYLVVTLFGADLGQIIYYSLYFILIFIFSSKLLHLLFGTRNTATKIASLFLAFNPFPLLLTTLIATAYVYPASIIFAYYLILFLKNESLKQLCFLSLSSYYLIIYLRLLPLILIFLIILLFLFGSNISISLKRLLRVGVVILLVLLPFFVNSFLSFTSNSNIVSNYKQDFQKYEVANYNFKNSFINAFSHPGGFTPSALSFFYNNRGIRGWVDNFAVLDSLELFKIIQILFNVGLLILAFLLRKRSISIEKIGLLILLIFFTNGISNFINIDTFQKLNSTILIFLYNDYGFTQFIQSFLYAFLIVITLRSVTTKWKKILITTIVLYLCVNIVPLLSSHYGLAKIKFIPQNIRQTFFQDVQRSTHEAALFIPHNWLKFMWAPYFIDLNILTNSPYVNLVSANVRVTGIEFLEFYNNIYSKLGNTNLENLALFNLKNLFLFKDVENADQNIDKYGYADFESDSLRSLDLLKERDDLKIIEESQHFVRYAFQNSQSYDFLIYSVQSVAESQNEKFFEKSIDLSDVPVLLERNAFQKPENLGYGSTFQNIHVSVKSSSFNATKHYVKFENVDTTKPFILQMNQTFGPSWKLKWVDDGYWNEKSCVTESKYYPITNNERCEYHSKLLEFEDVRLLGKHEVPERNHFEGNFIGNAWLVQPDNIPYQDRNSKTLHAVIIYERQIYYMYSLLISGLTFLVLILLTIRQEWELWRGRKNPVIIKVQS